MSYSSTFQIPEEKYWEPKAILEAEHGKEFPIEDVREIADELVGLYQLLMRSESNQQIITRTSNSVGRSF